MTNISAKSIYIKFTLVQIKKKRGPATLSLLAGPRKPRQWNKRTAHAGIY